MPVEFIRIEHTKEQAGAFRTSPQTAFFSFKGIQLLPNQIYPYTQQTNNPEGVEIEDYQVWVCKCGERLQDITTSFEVVRNFQDGAGIPQIEWSLTNIPFDAGRQLIYLEIVNGVNETYYTSGFYLTAFKSQYTSLWHYRDKESDTMLSTSLNIWFKQDMDETSIQTYDEVYTGRRTGLITNVSEYEIWQSDRIDYTIFRKFKQMLRNRFVYCDFERTGLYDAFETPTLEGRENFGEATIPLVRNNQDKYDPFYVAPLPPIPPPPVYTITLQRVEISGDAGEIRYIFTYDFVATSNFLYEYSLDGLNWTSISRFPVSPQSIAIPDFANNDYYYRISYLPLNTVSNVVQLELPLLNRYPTTGAAYSFRRLSASATWACQVRRSAGNTLKLIEFIPETGKLNIQQLLDFAGGFNCTVERWFDQSGTGKDFYQPDVTKQPLIVLDGELITENGEPAMLFDGVNDFMEVVNSQDKFKDLHSGKAMVNFVGTIGNTPSPIPQYVIIDTGGLTSFNIGYSMQTLNGNTTPKALFSYAQNGTTGVMANGQGNNFDLFNQQVLITENIDMQAISTLDRSKTRVNNNPEFKFNMAGAVPSTANSSKTFKIGVAHRIGAQMVNYLSGKAQELIYYPNDQSANTENIRNNINAHYDIW